MLHINGSEHRWCGDERYHELIVIMDDATSEIYYSQLIEARIWYSRHPEQKLLRATAKT